MSCVESFIYIESSQSIKARKKWEHFDPFRTHVGQYIRELACKSGRKKLTHENKFNRRKIDNPAGVCVVNTLNM